MSQTTKVTYAPITANDIKALRSANYVSFHHEHGRGVIYATRNGKRDGTTESTRRLEVQSQVVIWGRSSPSLPDWMRDNNAQCYASAYGSEDTWRTIASLLRAGDVLSIRWDANGHRNDYLKRATTTTMDGTPFNGINMDVLYLDVKRSARTMTFVLAWQTCPDNSARMIRH